MEYKKYLNYNVFENGDVVNSKGLILKPQKKGKYLFYKINGIKVCSGKIVLHSFGLLPLSFSSRVKRIDGNIYNNSLNNLKWE